MTNKIPNSDVDKNQLNDNSLIVMIDRQNVAHITLNRPSVFNAFDDALIAKFTEQLLQIEELEKVYPYLDFQEERAVLIQVVIRNS